MNIISPFLKKEPWTQRAATAYEKLHFGQLISAGLLFEVPVGVDEVFHLIEGNPFGKYDIWTVVFKMRGKQVAKSSQAIRSVLAAFMAATLELPLRHHRNLGSRFQRAVEMQNAIHTGVVVKDSLLRLAAD